MLSDMSGPQKHNMVLFQGEFIPEEDRGKNQHTYNGDTREPSRGSEWGD